MFIVSVGVPPLVSTVTASSKVTVAVTVSSTFKRPFCALVAEVSATALTVAGEVSTVTVKVALARPTLPARSVSRALKL